MCEFGERWSSNSRVYKGEISTPFVSFFETNFSDKLSQSPPDRFLENFYHDRHLIAD